MRLIDVILKTWSVRQTLQQQYEKALPQTRLNTALLEQLADSKPVDRLVDKPDTIAAYAERRGLNITRNDLGIPDRQPYSVNPGDIPADVFGDIEQNGAAPQGGRRHVGILVWEWLVARLKSEGIVLECDDEYAALDSMYCEKVAELAAEMVYWRREHPNATVPRDQPWVAAIEGRVDNEALAEQIMLDMWTAFGVRPERVESSEPLRIEQQPAGFDVIPSEILNPTREAQPLPRQARPKVDTGDL